MRLRQCGTMLARLTPTNRTRRYCALVFVTLLLCLLYRYIFFSLDYVYYAFQLYCIGTAQYTILVGPTGGNSSNSSDTNATNQIPLILHQTYRTLDSVPDKWRNTSESCRRMHSHWDRQYFWTDESGRQFIKEHFSAEALANYDSYMFPIQRADALRYYVLYHYGGVYLDLDIGCLAALDRRHITHYPFGLAATVPIGFSNDFIMARRGHPFLLHLIERLAAYNQWYINYYLTVMYSTGPMFLTINYIEYMQRQQQQQLRYLFQSQVGPDHAIYILNESLYGATNHTDRVFYHVEGSSWHNYKAPL